MDISILTAAGIMILISIIVYFIGKYHGYKLGYKDCYDWLIAEWKKEHRKHLDSIFGKQKGNKANNKDGNKI